MDKITVINPFEVPPGKEAQALANWERFAAHFSRQPGYINTKLHRALNPDARFHLINIAEWESAEHFQAALNNPDLQALGEELSDDIPHFPGLYEVIRT